MKISIITPSFNQGVYIEETIDSILSQGYNNLEYIIIDGGSNDNTVEIIKQYEKHLSLWISEPDNGQSHAINKGLKHVTGDIINWLNSDDYLEPGALRTISEVFENPNTNILIGRSNIVENGNILRQSKGTDIYLDNLAKTIGLARIDQPEHWWRKSVIDKIEPLNENLHYTMDRDWWIKYLLVFGLKGIEKRDYVLSNFRLHGDSKTVSEREAFNVERDTYFVTLAKHYGLDFKLENEIRNPDLIKNMPPNVNKDVLNKAMEYYYFLRADESYVKSDFIRTKEILEVIDTKVLDSESLKLYKNLKFRTNFPPGLINFARKLRS